MKRQIFAIIEVDWEDCDDIIDELILEDAIAAKVDGVKIFLDKAMYVKQTIAPEGENLERTSPRLPNECSTGI